MNANTIIQLSVAVVIATMLTGCKTTENNKTSGFSRFDAPRGQIGHVCTVKHSDAPRGQIGQTYAINTAPCREHLLPDSKRCV